MRSRFRSRGRWCPRTCPGSRSGGRGRRIVPSAPRPIVTRLSGMVGGSSKPASRRIASATTSRPTKKTSLPIVPVCQPITASVGPSTDLPAYHDMNDESIRTRPATQAIRAAERPDRPARPRLRAGLALRRSRRSRARSARGSGRRSRRGPVFPRREVWADSSVDGHADRYEGVWDGSRNRRAGSAGGATAGRRREGPG